MKILRFGAIWCSGCLVMKKTWKEIIELYPSLIIDDYDIDIDDVELYNLGSIIPVYSFIDSDGNELHRLIGEQKKEVIIDLINQYK